MQPGDCQICKYLFETALTAAQKSLKFLLLKCFESVHQMTYYFCKFTSYVSYLHRSRTIR